MHVYAENMQMFIDAVQGTDCRLNGSNDIDYMIKSLQKFNARDVLGLIVFANPMTKKCLKLISAFDDLFMFKPMPVIIVNDNAEQLYAEGHFKLKNHKLFLINSEENSISDIELNLMFVTLVGYSAQLYDLSRCPREKKEITEAAKTPMSDFEMSEQLDSLLKTLDRGELFENNCGSEQPRAGLQEDQGSGLKGDQGSGEGEEIVSALSGLD